MTHCYFCPVMAWSWTFVKITGQQRHHLSICPPQSVRCRLCVSAVLLCVFCMVTLTEVSLLFLVLCIALRKCSTPHSAGSSKGGVSWRRSHSSCTHSHTLSLTPCLSAVFASRSLSLFLPLLGAVKLHWTVIAHSIVQKKRRRRRRRRGITHLLILVFSLFCCSMSLTHTHRTIHSSYHDSGNSLYAHIYFLLVLHYLL